MKKIKVFEKNLEVTDKIGVIKPQIAQESLKIKETIEVLEHLCKRWRKGTTIDYILKVYKDANKEIKDGWRI